jgi:hypothetical protein
MVLDGRQLAEYAKDAEVSCLNSDCYSMLSGVKSGSIIKEYNFYDDPIGAVALLVVPYEDGTLDFDFAVHVGSDESELVQFGSSLQIY